MDHCEFAISLCGQVIASVRFAHSLPHRIESWVIGVRLKKALFDLSESNRIFNEEGMKNIGAPGGKYVTFPLS